MQWPESNLIDLFMQYISAKSDVTCSTTDLDHNITFSSCQLANNYFWLQVIYTVIIIIVSRIQLGQ